MKIMGWSPEQLATARQLGLEMSQRIRDRVHGDGPKLDLVVHMTVLVTWLERLSALSLHPKSIEELLNG